MLHLLQKNEPDQQTTGRVQQLALKQVSKSFVTDRGTVQALAPVDLSIARGEFLCVVGPSGCGKSTLLNIIAGLEEKTGGQVHLNDMPIHGTGPDRLVIFQEAALFPWLTVTGNVEFGLKQKGVPSDERRQNAAQAIASVGLSQFARAYPHELSGGMKQRVALARGLVLEPEVLLMDEPFAALDAQTRDRLHGELQELWMRTKTTIIFVTHNVREAACLGDRILLMSAHPGRIVKEYKVNIPHVRSMEDPGVMELARDVLKDLRGLSVRAVA